VRHNQRAAEDQHVLPSGEHMLSYNKVNVTFHSTEGRKRRNKVWRALTYYHIDVIHVAKS